MADSNLVDAVLSADRQTAIATHLAAIKARLSFLISLTAEERQALSKVYQYAKTNNLGGELDDDLAEMGRRFSCNRLNPASSNPFRLTPRGESTFSLGVVFLPPKLTVPLCRPSGGRGKSPGK